MDYTTLSLKELKELTSERNLEVLGHKGHKKSYIAVLQSNDRTTIETFSQDEPFTCAYPAQNVLDFIDLEFEVETVTSQAVERNFTSGASLAFLVTPIAMLIAGMVISGLWLTVSAIQLVVSLTKYLYPTRKLVDTGVTWFYTGLVDWVSFLFGDEDECAKSYQAVKDLMST